MTYTCSRCERTIGAYAGQCEKCRNGAIRFATVLANLTSMLTGRVFVGSYNPDESAYVAELFAGTYVDSDPDLLALFAEEEEIERRLYGR